MEQTGSKSGKEHIKAEYCHPAYLIPMQSTSWKMLVWIEAQAGIKIARRNINNFSYADDTTLMAESRGTKELFNIGESSVQFSRSVVSDSLRPHELQHTRLPCPSPTPGVHSDSRPSSLERGD